MERDRPRPSHPDHDIPAEHDRRIVVDRVRAERRPGRLRARRRRRHGLEHRQPGRTGDPLVAAVGEHARRARAGVGPRVLHSVRPRWQLPHRRALRRRHRPLAPAAGRHPGSGRHHHRHRQQRRRRRPHHGRHRHHAQRVDAGCRRVGATRSHPRGATRERSSVGHDELRRHPGGDGQQQWRPNPAVGHQRSRRAPVDRRYHRGHALHERHRVRPARRSPRHRRRRHDRATLGHRRPTTAGACRCAAHRSARPDPQRRVQPRRTAPRSDLRRQTDLPVRREVRAEHTERGDR
nr:hypothetical protein [Gordonia sp. OPL2]